VIGAWKRYGNRVTFDYAHAATDPERDPTAGISAGSCQLELRSDGLWATDVRWTPRAAAHLAAKEWLYFSPTFAFEKKTGRITSLVNIALTNIPATRNMQPLVAASRGTRMADDDKNEQLAEDPTKSMEADEKLADEPDGDEGADPTAPSDGDGDEDLSDDELKAAVAAFKAAKASKLAKAAALAAEEPPAGGASTSLLARLRGLTGKPRATADELVGVVRASVEAASASESLSQRLARLESKTRSSEVTTLVKGAIRAGKVAPANAKMIERLSKMGHRSIDELRGFVDAMPKIAGGGVREPEGTGTTAVASLSAEVRKIAKLAGHDPEAFAKVANNEIRYDEGEV
jgi:phage I-like protein